MTAAVTRQQATLAVAVFLGVILVLVGEAAATTPEPAPPAGACEPTRMVVIGDVHGDAEQLQVALVIAEVIDNATRRWSAPCTTKVVFMGDLVDRGHQDKWVLDTVMQLQLDARAAGSDVVVVLGNHELMNMNGQTHYVHPVSMEAFGGRNALKRSFAPDGKYGAWVRTFPIMHVEWNTLFVHAGLLPEFARRGVDELQRLAKEEIAAVGGLPTGQRHRSGDDDVLGVHGPVWTRKIVHRGSHGDCRDLEETLAILKLDRMIVGHTPQEEGTLGTFCDDKLIAVDVGMSRWMYGNMALLEMTRAENGDVLLHEITPRSAAQKRAAEAAESAAQEVAENGASTLEEELQRDPVRLQQIFDTMRQAEKWNSKDDL